MSHIFSVILLVFLNAIPGQGSLYLVDKDQAKKLI